MKPNFKKYLAVIGLAVVVLLMILSPVIVACAGDTCTTPVVTEPPPIDTPPPPIDTAPPPVETAPPPVDTLPPPESTLPPENTLPPPNETMPPVETLPPPILTAPPVDTPISTEFVPTYPAPPATEVVYTDVVPVIPGETLVPKSKEREKEEEMPDTGFMEDLRKYGLMIIVFILTATVSRLLRLVI